MLLALGITAAAEPARADAATRSISGTVALPEGAPLDYYRFVFVRATGLDGQAGGFVAVSRTDGSYTLDGLAPGRYRVAFPLSLTTETQSLSMPALVRTSYWPGAVTQGTSTPVDVTAADATRIDQTMEWSGTLSGKVTVLSESIARPNLSQVGVWLAGARGTHFHVSPGAYGFTFTNLPPDTYDVSFGASEWALPDVASEWYDDAYSYTDATRVTVAPRAAVTGIDAVLEKGAWSATPRPTIASRALTAGATLTARTGTWIPSMTPAYQWRRNGAPIAGATASTYRLTTADRGAAVTVAVTAVRAGFDAITRTSAPVGVPRVFATAPIPTVSGTPRVGKVLTAAAGTWSPRASLAYRWLRDGRPIAGASKASYTLTAQDRGDRIRVRVTGTRAGYVTATRLSEARLVR
ncbi:carboxypeptidase-like regulatory domain-containing protein [Demequina silvatica]|uniref:carboxypeptidase-like regulatory domain-containing protein n=1 Tax=Demequina silvatica TaxID=1638988 RepID=UPI0007864ACF|nr:carboxypeptidase-like regulatory domain-containing protein [Demequina silvatica]